ncbi:MAG TPA: hypothetical protein VHG93_17920, partial [Longimicrobium sp.]|nr:hypothetical protein [Longimicrobium sp.]
ATKSAMNLYFPFFVDFVAGKQTRRRELSFRRRRLHRTQPVQDFHGAAQKRVEDRAVGRITSTGE